MTVPGMNRHQRRALAKSFAKTAPLLAANVVEFDGVNPSSGVGAAVTSPIAIAALTRAIRILGAQNLEPVVIELTREQAHAFPHPPKDANPDQRYWLAVGIDVDTRIAHCLHALWFDVEHPRKHALWAQKTMLRYLSKLTGVSGMPGVPTC